MKAKNKAVIYILISVFCFSLMAALVKELKYIPVFEKVLFRNLVSLVIAYLVIKKDAKARLFGEMKNQKFLLLRSFLGFSGVVLNFYAFSNLELADSSILMRLAPFFVALTAYIFLKERLSRVKVFSMILGFSGAMLVIRPGFNLNIIPALAGFIASVFAGCAYTTVRFLSSRERAATIVFYFSFLSVVFCLPLVAFNYVAPESILDWFLLLGIGLFAGIAQIALTIAYKCAKAGEISIYNYLGIIFSTILGIIFFAEVPDFLSMIGGVIVISSAVINYWYRYKA